MKLRKAYDENVECYEMENENIKVNDLLNEV